MYVRVVKNTLARRAVAGTSFECLGPVLKGPLVLAFSKDDPGAAARVFKAFAKDNDKLVRRALPLGGQLLGVEGSGPGRKPADARAGARDADGRDEGAAKKLVATLAAAVPSKLVRTLAAVRDQKQAAAA